MIDRKRIEKGVIGMFKVNMGVRDGEKVLIVNDVPNPEEWRAKSSLELMGMLRRSILARMVSEIAEESLTNCLIDYFTYPSVGKSGTYPGKEVEDRMKAADVVIAITTHSLSHTDAREAATKAGARIASMPGFEPEMFHRQGPMSVDYRKMALEAKRLSRLLTEANEVHVRSRAGTDIRFSVEGRVGEGDTGIYTEKGQWGNLPAGEAYIAPLEGTAEGRIVVKAGWHPGLKRHLVINFKNGLVSSVEGGGAVGDELRALLSPERHEEPFLSRRNLAEFGVGLNPKAKRPDNILEAEKIRGTIHLAVGDNSHIGGKTASDYHEDFVVPKPDVILDGKLVVKAGRWMGGANRPLRAELRKLLPNCNSCSGALSYF